MREFFRKLIGIELEPGSRYATPVRTSALDLSHNVILYLDDITVSFDGFRALNKLTLAIDAGELRCIIGPNGAGKTTMMDVITGKTRPDSGSAFFGQTIDLTRLSEPQIAHTGIGRKFQKPTIFEQHSAFDLSHNVILYLDDITVSFDGFRALNKLTLAIDAGELRCIIGPNGAGKTTMMDVITGKTRPDSGSAFFGQTIDLTRLSEPQIAHTGIGRKFQKPTIFEQHSAFENLELAMKTDKRVCSSLRATLADEQRDRIAQTLRQIRLDAFADRPAGLLSHGQKQWLEIGMLLVQEPKLLLLDEPVAGMTDDETMRTAELFVSLAGQHSLVVVEHDMAFIKELGGKVTVLHEGSVLAEGDLDSVQNDQRVIEVYLGR